MCKQVKKEQGKATARAVKGYNWSLCGQIQTGQKKSVLAMANAEIQKICVVHVQSAAPGMVQRLCMPLIYMVDPNMLSFCL